MNGSMYNPEHISLEGFEIVERTGFDSMFTSRGISMTCFCESFRFTKAAAKALGFCEYMRIMQNRETNQLLVMAENSVERNSFRWFNPRNESTLEKNASRIMNEIFTRLGWDRNKMYIVDGKVIFTDDCPALLFELNQSISMERNQKKKA